jgi:GntR family transcriptional regulator
MNRQPVSNTAAQLGGDLMSAQVVNRLAQELRSGIFSDCSRLPAEVELAGTLGVSRTVIRDALSELEREGYIERVRGIGTVINRSVVALSNRLDQKLEFYSMIEAKGDQPRSDHVLVTKQKADAHLAESLALQTGDPVLCVCKRVFAGRTPVIYSTDVVPLSLFGGESLDGIDFAQPIFEILHRATGVQTTSSVAHVRALVGEGSIRRLLNVPVEKALLQLDEICYSRLCVPVMHCYTYYTDYFDFAILRKLL